MADASHELRTPLTVMHAAAGVTLKQPRREVSEYREAVEMLDEQARRLSRIVDDMFILARADMGRYPLRKAALYLNDLVEEVARAGGVLAAGKGVAVETADAPEAPFQGDEDLVRRMLLNLVGNAVRHTPSGGLVRLSLTRLPGEYRLAVSDTGPGVPPEARPHIFERFYRADKARSRSEDGGAGLGLAIARWVARVHEGELELADTGDTGATFIARLPFAPGK
jgi:signal transduction histidine kinase